MQSEKNADGCAHSCLLVGITAASCWCCRLGCRFSHASSIAGVNLACTTTRQRLARPCTMRLANVLAVLLGVPCGTPLQLTTAQRRLWVSPPSALERLDRTVKVACGRAAARHKATMAGYVADVCRQRLLVLTAQSATDPTAAILMALNDSGGSSA